MAFNNPEHFTNYLLNESNFKSHLFESRMNVWTDWIEKHLGEADGQNDPDPDCVLTESYKSIYDVIYEIIFWDLVESADKSFMLRKFEELKEYYNEEDKHEKEYLKQFLQLKKSK